MKFSAEIKKEKGRYVMIMPLYSSDQEQLVKLKQGVQYKFDVRADRNVLFHRKFFALLNLGFENTEEFKSFEHYRAVTLMRSGHHDTIITDNGTIYLPLSISFSSIDEIEFEEIFKRVLDTVSEQLDSAPVLIREQLNDFL